MRHHALKDVLQGDLEVAVEAALEPRHHGGPLLLRHLLQHGLRADGLDLPEHQIAIVGQIDLHGLVGGVHQPVLPDPAFGVDILLTGPALQVLFKEIGDPRGNAAVVDNRTGDIATSWPSISSSQIWGSGKAFVSQNRSGWKKPRDFTVSVNM